MGGVGGGLGVTVIIMKILGQIGLDWNWPTGTELGNNWNLILPLQFVTVQ